MGYIQSKEEQLGLKLYQTLKEKKRIYESNYEKFFEIMDQEFNDIFTIKYDISSIKKKVGNIDYYEIEGNLIVIIEGIVKTSKQVVKHIDEIKGKRILIEKLMKCFPG